MYTRVSLSLVAALAVTGCETIIGIQDTTVGDASGAGDARLPDSDVDAATTAGAPFIALRPPPYRTESESFVTVEGSAFTIEPQTSGEDWVLLLSATLDSDTPQSSDPLARYTVNGEVQGEGSTEHSIDLRGGPWQHFYLLDDISDAQEIEVQLRSDNGRGVGISQLSIVAFVMPEGSDYHYASVDDVTEITNAGDIWRPYHALSVTPDRDASYLILLLADVSELGSARETGLRWDTPSGTIPVRGDGSTEAQRYFNNPRNPLQSCFTARIEDLTTGGDYRYEMQTFMASSGGTVSYARALALSLDGFEGFATLGAFAEAEHTDAAGTVRAEVSVPPVAGQPRPHIIIQSTRAYLREAAGGERQIDFRIDGVTRHAVRHDIDTSGYRPSYGHFGVVEADADVTADIVTYGTATAPMVLSESVLHILQL